MARTVLRDSRAIAEQVMAGKRHAGSSETATTRPLIISSFTAREVTAATAGPSLRQPQARRRFLTIGIP